MTEVLCNAARNTREIIAEADLAIELLSGFGNPRSNAVGILSDPETFLIALNQASAAINRAITILTSTNWPNENDYKAL